MRLVRSTCSGCLCSLNLAVNALCSKIYQAWGAGRSVVSEKDKKEVSLVALWMRSMFHRIDVPSQLKKAKKEGKLAETLLDRRQKLKRYVPHTHLTSARDTKYATQ